MSCKLIIPGFFFFYGLYLEPFRWWLRAGGCSANFNSKSNKNPHIIALGQYVFHHNLIFSLGASGVLPAAFASSLAIWSALRALRSELHARICFSQNPRFCSAASRALFFCSSIVISPLALNPSVDAMILNLFERNIQYLSSPNKFIMMTKSSHSIYLSVSI